MPKEALATTLQDLSSLLTGMYENEALNVPHLRELRGQLAAVIEAIKALADEQAALEGRRQAVTQQLRGLVRFNIRPTRRRSRAKSEETPALLHTSFPAAVAV